MILKRVDKFRLFFWSAVAFAATALLVYLGGTSSLPRYLTLVAIRAIPQGIVLTLNLTFTPDIVEYGRFTTGIDARGIAFAIQSFAGKLISLAQPLGLFILGLFLGTFAGQQLRRASALGRAPKWPGVKWPVDRRPTRTGHRCWHRVNPTVGVSSSRPRCAADGRSQCR